MAKAGLSEREGEREGEKRHVSGPGAIGGDEKRAVGGKVEWDSLTTLEAMRWVLTHSMSCDTGKGNAVKLYREMYRKNAGEFRKLLLKLEEEEREIERLRLQALVAPVPVEGAGTVVVPSEPDEAGLGVIELMERLLGEVRVEMGKGGGS